MKRSSNGRAVQTTGYPMVCLVDIHGDRVGYAEKDIPSIQPEPCEADAWPAWTDCIRVKCGARDADHERLALAVLLDDAMQVVLDRSEESPIHPDDFDLDAGCGPIPDPLPETFKAPEEWPIEPPDDWPGDAAVGWASLPPGGVEAYRSPEDWAEYRRHFDREDGLYGYE